MIRFLVASIFIMMTATAHAEFKAGFVDMQKAIQSTKAGKKAKKELEAEFEKKKKDIKNKEDDFKKRVEAFEKKKQVLSDKVREETQMELQTDMRKFQEDVNKSQVMMQTKERELTKPILDKIQKLIADIAKEKDLSMIFEKSEQSVMWAKGEMDLTDEVIKRADK
jgi:outer membrane protein